ncbi:MAG: molybdate ABC transporter substrate-binding protein [Candidatus Odyssella sp.]|nr:molybdate ABC transporter substrate-binding protein [Candidatus Odyssella sp.]
MPRTGVMPWIRRAAAAAALAFSAHAAAEAPVVAAASDLKFAAEDIAAAYRGETGKALRLVFGSSGNFYQQIRQAAPFEIFLSADEDYVLRLAEEGLTADRGTLYAIGRIALIAPHGSRLAVDGRLEGLRAALAAGRIARFAIANPEHAPYGRRAQEALAHAGLWDAIRPKLVFGENVSQAAQYATSGSTEGGIVAYSLALAPPVARLGAHALIPEDWHRPLRQRMVLLKNASGDARRFYGYLQTPAARRIFKRHGFLLPGEEG